MRHLSIAAILSLALSATGTASTNGDSLRNAARADSVTAVRSLLRKGANVNEPGPAGETALHWAAQRNNIAVLNALIAAGAKVDSLDDHGLTPLAMACATAAAVPQNFSNPVHCVVISRDDLVYVCDRTHNRLQVFRKDGTFVAEQVIERTTKGSGSVHDIAFSADPDQTFMYVGDGANKIVWILRRRDLQVVGSVGSGGRNAGQFAIVHQVATDSKGNLYVGESLGGSRVQRFKYMGTRRQRLQ